LHVRLALPERIRSVGWASPDVDGGQFHTLMVEKRSSGSRHNVELTLPMLQFWDTLFLQTD
jgi:hypothetical protein